MTASEGGPPLGNMSAPPRSTLILHPFQAPEAAAAGNWGLAWYARVDFDSALRRLWPPWALRLDDKALPPLKKSHLRLCGAVALARGGQDHPAALEKELGEVLGDELLRLAPALPVTLPPLMLATAVKDPLARVPTAEPLPTLAILTHLTGRTCDPSGSPMLSEALLQGHTLDLWTAEAGHA